MITKLSTMGLVVAAGLVSGVSASASPIRVVVTGVVEYNQFQTGTFARSIVPANSPVEMRIDLDSTDFMDSPNLPGVTRGYRFNASTFSLTVGSVHATLRADVTEAFFVLRNNDPRVDGFFISMGTDNDVEVPLAMTPNNFGIAFKRTFNGAPDFPSTLPDPTLPSLELHDALGTWGYDNLSSFNFAVQHGEGQVPLGLLYESITVSAVTPVCAGDFGVAGGGAGHDGVLDNNDFIAFITLFFAQDASADCGVAGGEGGSDGAFDNNDFIAFINLFFAGC